MNMKDMETKPINWLGTNEEEEDEKKELKWSEPVKIPDGNYTGIITNISYRTEPYEYTDIFVKINNLDIEIKYGVPTKLSPQTRLGKLMLEFGEKCKLGEKINLHEILVNKKVKFMTIVKSNKDGLEYAEIVEDSLKPLNTL